jgi:uroporphyrinogen-III synthase
VNTVPAPGQRVLGQQVLVQRVLVVRAAHQSDRLSGRLRAVGLEPVTIPVIAMEPPSDGGVALRAALGHQYDWVVYTSSNAVAAAHDAGDVQASKVAVVGPGTAEAVRLRGVTVALEASISTADGLLEALAAVASGTALLPLAAGARPNLALGLRDRGWAVTAVEAYRTVPRVPSSAELDLARGCDAILFTSSSSVTSWMDVCSTIDTPAVVVSIGPQTSATAQAAGLEVTAEAHPHTLDGLVAATLHALAAPIVRQPAEG